MKLIRVGVDLAKNVFQLHGVDRSERVVWAADVGLLGTDAQAMQLRWEGALTGHPQARRCLLAQSAHSRGARSDPNRKSEGRSAEQVGDSAGRS